MKGRATAKAALAGQAAAWATVPLMIMPVPRWAWEALNTFGAASFYMSLGTAVVVSLWNILGSRDREEPPAPPELVTPAGELSPGELEALRQALSAALPGGLTVSRPRYIGPPLVLTPARGIKLGGTRVEVTGGGVAWVQGSPSMSSGRCAKCSEPMARHAYYGRESCITTCLAD